MMSNETHGNVTATRDEWWSVWFAEETPEEVTNNARENCVDTVRRVDDIAVLLRFSKRYFNANNERNDDASASPCFPLRSKRPDSRSSGAL